MDNCPLDALGDPYGAANAALGAQQGQSGGLQSCCTSQALLLWCIPILSITDLVVPHIIPASLYLISYQLHCTSYHTNLVVPHIIPASLCVRRMPHMWARMDPFSVSCHIAHSVFLSPILHTHTPSHASTVCCAPCSCQCWLSLLSAPAILQRRFYASRRIFYASCDCINHRLCAWQLATYT